MYLHFNKYSHKSLCIREYECWKMVRIFANANANIRYISSMYCTKINQICNLLTYTLEVHYKERISETSVDRII